jgi:hypothetical protein
MLSCKGVGVFSESELAYLGERRTSSRSACGGTTRSTTRLTSAAASSSAPRSSATLRGADAALVVDDLASTDPWRPRGIEIRGAAEAITDAEPLIRIHPERIVAWGLEGGRNARSVT